MGPRTRPAAKAAREKGKRVSNVSPVIIKAKRTPARSRATVLSFNLFVHISICDSKLTTVRTKGNIALFFSNSPARYSSLPPPPLPPGNVSTRRYAELVERYSTTRYKRGIQKKKKGREIDGGRFKFQCKRSPALLLIRRRDTNARGNGRLLCD